MVKRLLLCMLISMIWMTTVYGNTTIKKPSLSITADGLPAGHSTPEGAACDLARAFIKYDDVLFKDTCIQGGIYGNGANRKKYDKFIKSNVEQMKEYRKKHEGSPYAPKAIGIVYAARHLSKDGPASYAYATWDIQDVMFVDVGVYLVNGERMMNRTFVMKTHDGKWYVHPIPTLSPLLCDGLNEETQSTKTINDVYTLVPQKAKRIK